MIQEQGLVFGCCRVRLGIERAREGSKQQHSVSHGSEVSNASKCLETATLSMENATLCKAQGFRHAQVTPPASQADCCVQACCGTRAGTAWV